MPQLFILEHGRGLVVVETLQRQKGRGGVIRLTKTALCLGRTLRSQAVWEKQAAARLLRSKHIVRAAQERHIWRGGTGFDILTHTQAVVCPAEPNPPPPDHDSQIKTPFPRQADRWALETYLPRPDDRSAFLLSPAIKFTDNEASSNVIYWETLKEFLKLYIILNIHKLRGSQTVKR